MKIIRVLIFILMTLSLTFASQAQTIESEWSYAVTRSLQYARGDEAAQMIARANTATLKLFQNQGVLFKMIRLEGSSVDSFLFLPDARATHGLNQEAARLAKLYPEARLIYSPGHLMRGSDGFFSEHDQALGVSNTMVDRKGGLDPTFYHEMVHANHFFHRMKGGVDPLSASFTVIEKDIRAQLSEVGSGYRRIQTLEEIEAHLVSLVYLAKELEALKNANAKIDSIEHILNLMYQTAEDGDELSRQSVKVIGRVLNSNSWSDGSKAQVETLGSKKVYVRELFFMAAPDYANGAKASFKFSKAISDEVLKANLMKAETLAAQMAPVYKKVCDSMYWMIERVDAKRTNVADVLKAVQKVQATFEAWKKSVR